MICLDLSALGNIPNLLELDASHNQISSVLDFPPPKNLKAVDLSFNNIDSLTDLSAHHYLQKLDLNSILFMPQLLGLSGYCFHLWYSAGRWQEKVCPACISKTVRCRKLILGRDIGYRVLVCNLMV